MKIVLLLVMTVATLGCGSGDGERLPGFRAAVQACEARECPDVSQTALAVRLWSIGWEEATGETTRGLESMQVRWRSVDDMPPSATGLSYGNELVLAFVPDISIADTSLAHELVHTQIGDPNHSGPGGRWGPEHDDFIELIRVMMKRVLDAAEAP